VNYFFYTSVLHHLILVWEGGERLSEKNTTLEAVQFAVIDGDFKLISTDNGYSFQLYYLKENGIETIDISETQNEKAATMKIALDYWCSKSAKGMYCLD
jgi:hypothetical protein